MQPAKIIALVVAFVVVSAGLGLRSQRRLAAVFAGAGGAGDHEPSGRRNALPGVIFWAWERPEDFRFLKAQQAGVAFLAETIYLQPPSGAGSSELALRYLVRPRLQPLRVASGTPLVAVVRIENPANGAGSAKWAVAPERREAMASEIAALQSLSGIRAIQIDFDATTVQHAFYSALLQDVRGRLPSAIPLSITALASWCIGDPWLAQMPSGTIDEAVPMLFRMGADAGNVASFLRDHKEFRVPACQSSLGISTDEPFSQQLLSKQLPALPVCWRQKRVYVFAPRAWTPSVADSILQEWQQ
jgi:Protein of unknown function (DUF3142)